MYAPGTVMETKTGEKAMDTMTYVPYGTDTSAGEYRCVDCGHKLALEKSSTLPPCPERDTSPHEKLGWEVLSGCGAIPAKDCLME